MKPDKRFTSPTRSVSNKTLNSQQRIEKSPPSRQYRSANYIRRASAVSYEIGTIKEGECLALNCYDRRMSAPELPPILDSRKYSNNQSMGNGNHEYFKTRSNGLSNSDSSQKGGRFGRSPQSASSSSSQHTAGQNGNIVSRSKTWITPDQTITTTIPEGVKLDSITNRNGVSVQTPRSVKNGHRTRLSSKDLSTSSGNNNTKPGKTKFHHCASEPKIQPIEAYMGGNRSKTTMKRNFSDNKLGLNNKKMLSIEKTQPLTQNKYSSGNVNGMRRYSSTVQLNSVVKNKSETDDYEDDDTDSESGKDQMIIEWLIGVQNEAVEVPPDPDIEYTEAPVQTDTAIHIVYSES